MVDLLIVVNSYGKLPEDIPANCRLFESLQILHTLGIVGEPPHGLDDLIFAFHDLQHRPIFYAAGGSGTSPAKQ